MTIDQRYYIWPPDAGIAQLTNGKNTDAGQLFPGIPAFTSNSSYGLRGNARDGAVDIDADAQLWSEIIKMEVVRHDVGHWD
jgi:hypothetical protein